MYRTSPAVRKADSCRESASIEIRYAAMESRVADPSAKNIATIAANILTVETTVPAQGSTLR